MKSAYPEESFEYNSIPSQPFNQSGEVTPSREAAPPGEAFQRSTPVETARHTPEERLQMALQVSQMGTFVWHVEQDRGDPDARTLALFGLGSKDSLTFDKAFHTLLHPGDRTAYAQAVAKAIDPKGNGTFCLDARVLHPDGSEHWLNMAGKTFFAGEPPQPVWMLGTVMDITARKQAEAALQASEARHAYLLRLSDALRSLADPVVIQATVTQTAMQYFGADRCYYCEIEGDTIIIRRDASREGLPSMVGVYPMRAVPIFKAVVAAGRPFVVEDASTSAILDEEVRQISIQMQILSFVNVPLIKHGKPAGVLCLTQGQPRAWTELEVALAQETAERTWSAVERAKAEAALRESEARFRLMVDALPLSIWITDAYGRTEYLNQHWCHYCGVQFDPITADEIAARFLHPEDGPKVMEVFSKAMQTGTPWETEQRNRSAQGEYRWFLNRAYPYRDLATGHITKWIGVGIDIHDRKLAEQQRQRLAEELANANQDLHRANENIQASNQELAVANQRLSHINVDLDNFIYTASHDLKAPILNIEGLLRILSRKMEHLSLPDAQLAPVLLMMEESVHRFKQTIGDLTDIARIGKQLDGEREPVDLKEIVQDTLLDLQQQVEATGAEIEQNLNACPQVLFPRKNLKSVVYNLLSNALKYRDPNRPLRVAITCQPEGGFLLLQVQDNGLGMDTSDPEKIFGMFKRQHTHVEGTGVGLYIVKKMIENAGGKIEVESQLSVGSTFRVYFPL